MKSSVSSGDLYISSPELSQAECEAIETLCGLHPRLVGEGPIATKEADLEAIDEAPPEQVAFLIFLINAVRFAKASPFRQSSTVAMADLMDCGEFLMDTCNLATKVAQPSRAAMVLASVMASIYVDAAGRGMDFSGFVSLWDEVYSEAQLLMEQLAREKPVQ